MRIAMLAPFRMKKKMYREKNSYCSHFLVYKNGMLRERATMSSIILLHAQAAIEHQKLFKWQLKEIIAFSIDSY